jgi:hypothetical protein
LLLLLLLRVVQPCILLLLLLLLWVIQPCISLLLLLLLLLWVNQLRVLPPAAHLSHVRFALVVLHKHVHGQPLLIRPVALCCCNTSVGDGDPALT